MLVKKINNGKVVPYSAEEVIHQAVIRAIKLKNTLETVYWVDRRSIQTEDFKTSSVGLNGGWEAWIKGRVNIGKTVAATGQFHDPKPYDFSIHYKSCLDEIGVPDITVVGSPDFVPVETNFAASMVTATTAPAVVAAQTTQKPLEGGVTSLAEDTESAGGVKKPRRN